MTEKGARWAAAAAVVSALAALAPTAAAQDGYGLSQSHLRKAVIALPAGLTLSPGAAGGMRACTDDQLRLRHPGAATCPDASKVGTVEIESPPVPNGLTGSVYVRPSTPEHLFRIALTASGSGVNVKLPGEIVLDPVTGQVTATFVELPQLPFSALRLRFFGGQRAVLTNPIRCGSYRVESVFSPWSGTAPVPVGNPFTIAGDRCSAALPFDPHVTAGTVDPVAAASTPFVFRAQRDDGHQELQRITVALPPGLTAVLAGVPLCAAAQAGAGSCGERSRIGTITVGAGAGGAPLYLRGGAYLTEGYAGGQFGLTFVVRAVAGPFDLGTVVVRAAIHVDPKTAQLTIVSDALPRILRGVVLRLRDVHLAIDRERFMRNGTSCRRMSIGVEVTAAQGGSVRPAVPFQLADCRALRFKPRFGVRLLGRGRTTDGKKPGLRIRVRARRGDANLRRVAFTLPPQIAFDASRGGPRLCTRAQLAVRECPKRSRVGRARADTPLLDAPLRGPVYFIRGVKGDAFPKLAMLLDGQLRIDLLGSTSVKRRGLITAFSKVPDVPIHSFTLRLGPGLLTPTRNLCARKPVSSLTMRGQNGRRVHRRVRIKVPCKRGHAKRGHEKRGHEKPGHKKPGHKKPRQRAHE